MITYLDKILNLLNKNRMKYDLYNHEAVSTSEEAAKARGDTALHQGAKALVLQADNSFILFVLPGDLRADLVYLQKLLKVKKLRMASRESILSKIGLEVGSIPPFGSIMKLKTFVDSRLSENSEIAFNAGRRDTSIKMKYNDYLKLENPQVVELA